MKQPQNITNRTTMTQQRDSKPQFGQGRNARTEKKSKFRNLGLPIIRKTRTTKKRKNLSKIHFPFLLLAFSETKQQETASVKKKNNDTDKNQYFK